MQLGSLIVGGQDATPSWPHTGPKRGKPFRLLESTGMGLADHRSVTITGLGEVMLAIVYT